MHQGKVNRLDFTNICLLYLPTKLKFYRNIFILGQKPITISLHVYEFYAYLIDVRLLSSYDLKTEFRLVVKLTVKKHCVKR